MEDVLDVYELPYNPTVPVVCMDEKPYQLLGEVRESWAMRPGDDKKVDSEYTRNGTCSIFAFIEPLGGTHHISVREHRTAKDWAEEIKLSGDRRFGIMKEQYLTIEDKEECNNMCLLLDMCEEEGIQKGMQKGILLAAQVIRLNSGGKDENEISRELGADLSVVEDILSLFRESAEV